MKSESLQLDGPAGPIEALLESPDEAAAPAAFAIVCHPHPLFGGTLTNKVVHTLARACVQAGAPALRFNFRGVGASAGVHDHGQGEVEDLLAVVDWGRRRWPQADLWLGGFSFGAYVALRGSLRAGARRLITVAPPVGRWDFSEVRLPRCPWLIIQGDSDELVDAAAMADWARGTGAPHRLLLLPGADHFFHGRLHELKDAVAGFLAAPGER
ncbi:MAG: hypothetical protein U1F11_14485 [Steroidobacteraceae bacterium]